MLLDQSDAPPDNSYTLEVSSPGADRRLEKQCDFERVIGREIGLTLTRPLEGQLRWEGKLNQVFGRIG